MNRFKFFIASTLFFILMYFFVVQDTITSVKDRFAACLLYLIFLVISNFLYQLGSNDEE